jgi:glycerophosphoryl diester phosphodiesterase
VKSLSSILLFTLICAAPIGAADLPQSAHPFIVIAHRGCRAEAHENTIKALQDAIAAQVDYAEIDVRRTRDGRYILLHDSTVDRMTDGHGPVKQLTFEQVRKLHVRDAKRPQIAADRIPTFEEALLAVKGKLNIYLDFKEGDRAEVTKAIRDAGVSRQILVYDGVESIPEWRRVAPEFPLIISPPVSAKSPQALTEFIRKYQVEVLDDDWQFYSPEMLAAATKAGAKVWPDIQEDNEGPDYFKKVMAIGFNGVQTDHPNELTAWLKDQGRR